MEKKRVSLLLCLLVCFQALETLSEAKGQVIINTSGHKGVCIDCPSYIAGTKAINVYSNKTVRLYQLLLNGSAINSKTNPRQYNKGYWLPFDYYLGTQRGQNFNGTNIMQVCYSDNVLVSCESQRVRVSGVWHEYLDTQAHFGVSGCTYGMSYINGTNIVMDYKVSGIQPGTLQLQIRDFTTSSWTTITSLTSTLGKHLLNYSFNINQARYFSTGNSTSISNQIDLRIDGYQATSGNKFQVQVDQITIYYFTSVVLSSNNLNYNLIDSYNLISTSKVDGVYNLTAKIVDFAGNTWSDMKWIVVDNTLPAIAPLVITPPSGLNNTIPISITTMITDKYLNNSFGKYNNGYQDITFNNGNKPSFNYTNYYTNMTYTFNVYAYDQAGNYAFTSKTFTVAFHQVTQYIQNPSISISHVDTSYPGTTAWTNVTCMKVGNMKQYVNGTLNATVNNPSDVRYGFNSTSGPKQFNIVLAFTYMNGSWYKNISFTVKFLPIPIIYVNEPCITISCQTDQYIGKTAWLNITCSNIGQIQRFVNGTLNATVNNPSDVRYGFNSTITQTINVLLKFYYENGTWYNDTALMIKFLPMPIIYIDNPEISIIQDRFANITSQAWLNVTMIHVSKIRLFTNGTFTSEFTSSFNHSLASSAKQTFIMILESFYENASFYENFTVLVTFINMTAMKEYINLPANNNPLMTIAYSPFNFIKQKAWINVTSEYIGQSRIFVDEELNTTYSNPNYNFSLESSTSNIFNVTLQAFYINGTFFKNFSMALAFSLPQMNQTILINPSMSLSYPAVLMLNQAGHASINTENSGKLKITAINNGSQSQVTIYNGNQSLSINIFTGNAGNVTFIFSIYYNNDTLWKNITAMILIKSPSILQVYLPFLQVNYPSKVLIGSNATITIESSYARDIVVTMNKTINTIPGNISTNIAINSSKEGMLICNATVHDWNGTISGIVFFNISIYVQEPSRIINLTYTQFVTYGQQLQIICSTSFKTNLTLLLGTAVVNDTKDSMNISYYLINTMISGVILNFSITLIIDSRNETRNFSIYMMPRQEMNNTTATTTPTVTWVLIGTTSGLGALSIGLLVKGYIAYSLPRKKRRNDSS